MAPPEAGRGAAGRLCGPGEGIRPAAGVRVVGRRPVSAGPELLPDEPRAPGKRPDLAVAHAARAPAEAAVRIHVELVGRPDLEDLADPLGDLLGRLGMEALDVDHPGAEL